MGRKMMEGHISMKIKDYLSRSLRNYEIKQDDNIFELGIVHSLFAIQLILFIEKSFGIELEDEDLDFDRIKTVNDIVQLIEDKNKKGE
jgi:acyl carrier protein